MKFKAAIFDLDGTLVDSFDIWKQIDIKFLEKRGFCVTDDYLNKISACSFREAAEYTISRFGLCESAEEIMDEWHGMAIYEYSHNIPLVPNASDYIKKLKELGVKTALATSAIEELYKPCLENNRIHDLFDVTCSVDEVGRGKNYPDIYLHISDILGIKAGDCIVFEDVLPAVKSAKKAGMKVYGVYNGNYADTKEIEKEADGLIRSFADAPLP